MNAVAFPLAQSAAETAAQDPFANLVYLVAASLFILGLRMLSHPRTAVRGNLLGALGMLLAAGVTLWRLHPHGLPILAAGLLVGTVVGTVMALRVPMTGMPQMVGLLNGFGGGASVLVAWAELFHPRTQGLEVLVATAASGLIGGVTFAGSLIAVGKLQGFRFERPTTIPGHHAANAGLVLVALALGGWLMSLDPAAAPSSAAGVYFLLVLAAGVLGAMLVLPIGGADMPVVIALLNSYSGLAAAATGFVISNTVLIIGGSLVGASGIILTQIMCKAMNRSLANVLFGGVGAVASAGPSAEDVYGGRVKSADAGELAMLLADARRVVIVPGYGMAVAQAQHAVRDLYRLLEQRGAEVQFAIHPVAGRMPGHMNVLLAEADIPYDKLLDLDQANPLFEQTDMAIVIGANDVVNPVARTDPQSPIAGMPILDVDKSRTVVVVKRSLSPGFAGIPNPLFAADNTLMFFADAKQGILDLVSSLKEL